MVDEWTRYLAARASLEQRIAVFEQCAGAGTSIEQNASEYRDAISRICRDTGGAKRKARKARKARKWTSEYAAFFQQDKRKDCQSGLAEWLERCFPAAE